MLTAIPLYLWDVFNPKTKLANVFFLIVSVLQCIPSISLTNCLPSSLPSLLTIIGAEAIHLSILESKRRKSDRETNSRRVILWSNAQNCWIEKEWGDIHVDSLFSPHFKVGDILKVHKNEDIPCDMVILSTSDQAAQSTCFITTTNIDGETDIKSKVSLRVSSLHSLLFSSLVTISVSSLLQHHPVLFCEAENPNTSSFDGIFQLTSTEESIHGTPTLDAENTMSTSMKTKSGPPTMSRTEPSMKRMMIPPTEKEVEYISIASVLLRGCRVVFTDWVVGCAVAVGTGTKIEFSTRSRPPMKASDTLMLLNRCILYLLVLLFGICLLSAVFSVLWDSRVHANIPIDISSYTFHFVKSFFVYFQLCYQIVPASLYVCVEIAFIFPLHLMS